MVIVVLLLYLALTSARPAIRAASSPWLVLEPGR